MTSSMLVTGVLGVATGSAMAGLAWARARRQVVRLSDENARLAEENQRDPLTGLANRRGIDRALGRALARPGAITGVLYVDLDDFKGVNDRHGHRCGDQALVTIAARLLDGLPADACAGRMGGDELVVVLPALEDASLATELAAAIRTDLARPIDVDGLDSPLRVTVSIGVAAIDNDCVDHACVEHNTVHLADDVIERANTALRRAKASGRDCVMAATNV